MTDRLSIKADSPEQLAKIGHSLARTLYRYDCDILVDGDLGVGKTTFLKGFANGMGVPTPLLSPTFALEERHRTARHGDVIHIDLYRLTEMQAVELLLQTEEHEGLRCIEWAKRAPSLASRPVIAIAIDEQPDTTRTVTIHFRDAPIPSPAAIEAWRRDVRLPAHVQAHCHCVTTVAVQLADALLGRGSVVRRELLRAAAELHDLLRFLDFTGLAAFPSPTADEEEVWRKVREEFAGMRHEEACAAFLIKQGYPEAATIVRTHGVALPPDDTATVEQALLYYSDKRCAGATVVTIDERFDDFRRRYGDTRKKEAAHWRQASRDLETRLFDGEIPAL